LVSAPSAFVVLQNNPGERGSIVRYRVLEGEYNFARSSLENAKPAKGTVHTEIRQAFTAVRLAQRAGAGRWASDEYLKARRALDQLVARRHQGVDRTQIAAEARATVRLAVDAQRLAQDRAFQQAQTGLEGSGGGKGETEKHDHSGVSENVWRER